MGNIKFDKESFYNMMESLFNNIYGPNYVLKNKEEISFRKVNQYYTGEYEEYSLVTKENKKILVNTQISRGVLYSEIATNKEGNNFDTNSITLEEIKEMVKNDVLDYNFLSKILSVLSSLKNEENIKDDKVFINEELSFAICSSFKRYIKREQNAEKYLQTDIYEETIDEILPCQKILFRKLK